MWWIYDDALESGRFCCDCYQFLLFDNYKTLRHGWKGRHSRRRICDMANARLLYQLKKHYPYPQRRQMWVLFANAHKTTTPGSQPWHQRVQGLGIPPMQPNTTSALGKTKFPIKVKCQPPLQLSQQKSKSLHASRANTKLHQSCLCAPSRMVLAVRAKVYCCNS